MNSSALCILHVVILWPKSKHLLMLVWQIHELAMKLALQKSQNAELRSHFEGIVYSFSLMHKYLYL